MPNPRHDQATLGDQRSIMLFTRQQQAEIEMCVELTTHLVDHLTTIDSVKHVVVTLCELLDVVWLNQTVRGGDIQMNNANEVIIAQIHCCMSKLFTSHIGNCSMFTFFTGEWNLVLYEKLN